MLLYAQKWMTMTVTSALNDNKFKVPHETQWSLLHSLPCILASCRPLLNHHADFTAQSLVN